MPRGADEIKIKLDNVDLYYGSFHALGGLSFDIYAHAITAVIGPSGCGKSSLLRLFNRMNDLVPTARVTGEIFLDGAPIREPGVDVAELRKKVGMVFQKPNIFPMSVYDNVVVGPKNHGIKRKSALDEITRESLRKVALWDEVKDGLNKSGFTLSAGQQQRLCIARALAVEPDVLLMDESCSALDHESTSKIEDLMLELKKTYTIIIVTHNMEQARRISDYSAFFMLGDDRVGRLCEYSGSIEMFSNPQKKLTMDYISGRYG